MSAKAWVLLAAISAAAAPSVSAPARKQPLPTLTVVSSGSEQALKTGDTVLPRPFGAQLIDGLSVLGRYGDARQTLFLVEGHAGTTCPARYVVVAIRRDQAPAISAPFGNCGTGATAQSTSTGLAITVAPGPGDVGPQRFLYTQGSIRPLDAPASLADASAAGHVLRCRNPGDMAARDSDGVGDDLDRTLPAGYRTSSGVRRADIAPAELHQMVAGLACLAAVPGNGDPVFRAATPLFASKRYGGQAFAALDRIAGATNSEPGLRASARVMSAQMSYFVGRREPL